MAGREGTSAHEQHLPTVEVGLNHVLLRISGETLTSFDRFVSGHEVINCMIVPYSIHWETIIKLYEDFVAPTNGNRFGCLSCFHITTSRQKSYPAPVSTWQVSVLQEGSRRTYHFHVCKVCPGAWNTQYLDCDLGATVHSTPHVRVATSARRRPSDPLHLVGYGVRGW